MRYRHFLAALWLGLFDPTQRPIRYLGRALIVDLPFAFLVAPLVVHAIPSAKPDFTSLSPVALLVGACVLSPLIETLGMILVFAALRWLVRSTPYLALLSALVWAVIHSFQAAVWGLVIFWPFFIFSICFLTWEQKSRAKAYTMTATLHALHNLPPVLLMIAGGGK